MTGPYGRQIGFCCDMFNKIVFDPCTANKSRNGTHSQMHISSVGFFALKKSVKCTPSRTAIFPVWFGFYGACSQLRQPC